MILGLLGSVSAQNRQQRLFSLDWELGSVEGYVPAFPQHRCLEPRLLHLQENLAFAIRLGSFRPLHALVRKRPKLACRCHNTPPTNVPLPIRIMRRQFLSSIGDEIQKGTTPKFKR